MKYKLSAEDIKSIERTLDKGDRVEVVPAKERLNILRVRRESINKGNIASTP